MSKDNFMNSYIDGAVKSPFDIRDYRIVANKEFPEEFATAKVPVKNQGMQSTCVAHALATIVEYHNKRQQGNSKKFSTEFIHGCRFLDDRICEGRVVRDALKVIQKFGDPYNKDFMGNSNCSVAMKRVAARFVELKKLAYPHRISYYFRLKSADEMKTALTKYGPIIVTMRWYSNYTLTDGVYHTDSKEFIGHHCVVIYGWCKDGWLTQNSWGTFWGDRGRFIIPFEHVFVEAWGVADDIICPDDFANPQDKFFVKVFGKLINWLAAVFVKIFNNKQ